MVQTVKTVNIQPGHQKMVFEKPHVLCRVYFKIAALLTAGQGYRSFVSFDDPLFRNYYTLLSTSTNIEAKGEGIFQGDIWVRNQSSVSIDYAGMEILV